MTLQIPEGAVVGEDVEPIPGALERAAGLVTTIGAVADVGTKNGRAFVGGTDVEPDRGAGRPEAPKPDRAPTRRL